MSDPDQADEIATIGCSVLRAPFITPHSTRRGIPGAAISVCRPRSCLPSNAPARARYMLGSPAPIWIVAPSGTSSPTYPAIVVASSGGWASPSRRRTCAAGSRVITGPTTISRSRSSPSSSTIPMYASRAESSSTRRSHASTNPRVICTGGISTNRSISVTWIVLSPQTGLRPASTSAITVRARRAWERLFQLCAPNETYPSSSGGVTDTRNTSTGRLSGRFSSISLKFSENRFGRYVARPSSIAGRAKSPMNSSNSTRNVSSWPARNQPGSVRGAPTRRSMETPFFMQ